MPKGAFVMHNRLTLGLGVLLRNQGVVQSFVLIMCMEGAFNLLQLFQLLVALLNLLLVLTTCKCLLFVELLLFWSLVNGGGVSSIVAN